MRQEIKKSLKIEKFCNFNVREPHLEDNRNARIVISDFKKEELLKRGTKTELNIMQIMIEIKISCKL